ncbi:MAG: hypothetical protein WDZ94_05275 [Patescibacteria group bacterium]
MNAISAWRERGHLLRLEPRKEFPAVFSEEWYQQLRGVSEQIVAPQPTADSHVFILLAKELTGVEESTRSDAAD